MPHSLTLREGVPYSALDVLRHQTHDLSLSATATPGSLPPNSHPDLITQRLPLPLRPASTKRARRRHLCSPGAGSLPDHALSLICRAAIGATPAACRWVRRCAARCAAQVTLLRVAGAWFAECYIQLHCDPGLCSHVANAAAYSGLPESACCRTCHRCRAFQGRRAGRPTR